MNKRTVRILGLLILAVMTVTVFSGCDLLMALFGGKVVARIESFESDLNSTFRSGIYRNFHQDMQDYDVITAESWWDTAFPSDYSYSFEDINADDDALTATATLTVNEYGNPVSSSVSFTFKEDGSDVLILSFNGYGENIYQILGTTPVTRE